MMVKWSLVGLGKVTRSILPRNAYLMGLLLALLMLGLTACSNSLSAKATLTLAVTDTATPLPSATFTLLPTATVEPTATPTRTPLPPTTTPLPPLAVQPDGFDAWCAPVEYAGSVPAGPDAPDYARRLTTQDGAYRVQIPATYCTIVFHLNQTAPNGLELRVLEGQTPFIQQPLVPAQGQPDTVWTSLTHDYVVNPPLWEITHTLSVVGSDGKELWSNPVTFAKALPEPCPYGGLPDPVTLYCAVTDPWEIEPWPDVEYPYDRSRLTPSP